MRVAGTPDHPEVHVEPEVHHHVLGADGLGPVERQLQLRHRARPHPVAGYEEGRPVHRVYRETDLPLLRGRAYSLPLARARQLAAEVDVAQVDFEDVKKIVSGEADGVDHVAVIEENLEAQPTPDPQRGVHVRIIGADPVKSSISTSETGSLSDADDRRQRS